MSKPLCSDMENFTTLSSQIGQLPASRELNCLLSHNSNFSIEPVGTVNDFFDIPNGISSSSFSTDIAIIVSALAVAYVVRMFL